MSATEAQIARLLTDCARGDREAADRLFSLVYEDLRAMAHRHLRGEAGGHTLNTTALVHEADLALVDRTRSGSASAPGPSGA